MSPRAATLRSFDLLLFGGVSVLAEDGQPIGGALTHRHRLALLALLAVAHPSGVQRDRLVALLWPERETSAARHLLRVALHELRRTLGVEAIVGVGTELRLDPSIVRVDAHAFDEALAGGEPERAVALYRGPLLDGFGIDDAQEFERWLDRERADRAHRFAEALATLAADAAAAGDAPRAAAWWRRLADERPADREVALAVMDALAASGDVGGALDHAAAYGAHLRAEYDIAPDAVVNARVAALRRRLPTPRTAAEPVPEPVADPVAERVAEAPVVEPVVERTEVVVPAAPPAPVVTVVPIGRARSRRWSAAIAAVVVVGVIGAALAWTTSRRGLASDAIAVAPFTVLGGAPADLAEGLPDLLVANLDQVADVHVVPSRITIAQAAAHASAGDASPAQLARDVRASAILTGVVVPWHDGVEVRAALVSAAGVELAQVQARGSVSDLGALVDQLSVAVLRQVWGRRWGIPTPRLAAVGTTSTRALRAYIQGEAFLRGARWDSAAALLAQAVDIDSTFALAHLRLAETYGWRATGKEQAEHELAIAQRWAGRLPPRERSLLTLRQLYESASLAALDSVVAMAARYPFDPEIQYMRADVRFHARPLFGEAFAQSVISSFETAAALDSMSARVFAHPLNMALERGDRPRFDHAVERLTAIGEGSHLQVPQRPDYALLRAVRWSPPADAVRLVTDRLRTAPPTPPEVEDLLQAVERACLLGPSPAPDLLDDVYPLLRETYGDSLHLQLGTATRRALVAAGRGRLRAAQAMMDDLWQDQPRMAPWVVLMPVVFGYATPAWTAGETERLARAVVWNESPTRRRQGEYWRAMFALAARDTLTAQAYLHRAVASPHAAGASDSVPASLTSAVQTAEGWVRLIAGDTTGAIRTMEANMTSSGYDEMGVELRRPLRALYLRLLAALPSRRADAIDGMRADITRREVMPWAWQWRDLADALTAEGKVAEGDDARARFAALWRGADRR